MKVRLPKIRTDPRISVTGLTFSEQTVVKIPAKLMIQLGVAIEDVSAYLENSGAQNSGLMQELDTLKSSLRAIEDLRKTTFPFSRLPMELRLKIWKYAAMVPQIIGFIH
jgi:hypothetical protein